jgi:hypothetical protein
MVACFAQSRTRAAISSGLLPFKDEAGLQQPPQPPDFIRISLRGWVGSTPADGITSGVQGSDVGFILEGSGLDGCVEVTATDAGSFRRCVRVGKADERVPG